MKLPTLLKNTNNILLIVILIMAYFFYKNMKFSKYFKKEEFDSKDGAPMPYEVKKNIRELAKNLDVIREYIGKPIHVNSGYRSPDHNIAVGGVTNSFHMIGKASDIHVKGMTTTELKNIIEKLINEGKISQGGLGFYPTWVHYDIRGIKARWNG